MRNVCPIDGCGKPVAGRGLCRTHWSHDQRYGTPYRSRRKFDTAAQHEVLSLLRQGKTLEEAARLTGWSRGGLDGMLHQGRQGRGAFAWFYLEYTRIRRVQRFGTLTVEGREFLLALLRQTDASLHRDPSRWRELRVDELPTRLTGQDGRRRPGSHSDGRPPAGDNGT